MGSIIGSGIFLKVGNVDTALKEFGFAPIIGVWCLVGLVTLCGSLALGELAGMYPRAGGPYLYLREAYGELSAFLWGWTEFWVVRSGSVGALACATAIYFNHLWPIGRIGQELLAIGIVLGLTLAGVLSTRWSASIQNGFAVTKVVFLAGIIVLPWGSSSATFAGWSPLLASEGSADWMRALGAALIAVMWPYDGWINVAPIAEDMRKPQSDVPKALAIGLGMVVTIYVLANLSYHLVLSMDELAKTETVAADLFERMFGSWGAKIAALGVMCSTFGATNSNMLCGPRIYMAMARDGLLPGGLERISPRWRTPARAIIAQSVWTILLIVGFYAWKEDPKGAFDGLTDSVIFAGLVFYSLTVAAVYVLRARFPNHLRPYRTWGYPLTPALLLGVYAFAFVRILIDQWEQMTAVMILIGSGIGYFLVAQRFRRRG